MNRTRIALLVVVVAALAGGGSALAARGHNGPPGGGPPPLTAAATYLGVTDAALRTQLRSGKTLAEVADSTTGKSAAGLIAALVADAKARLGSRAPADLQQHIADLVDGVHPGMHMHGGGPPQLDAAATYLGISAESLHTQLRSGKTLAQIANGTSGKSAQGLIDALVADARAHITQLVNG